MQISDLNIDTSKSALIIAPSAYHVPILKEINSLTQLWDFDLMTRDDFIANHCYTPTRYAKSNIHNEFNLMPHIIDTIFTLIPYADQVELMPEPFNQVLTVLKQKKWIEKKPWSQQPLKQQIIFWGYPYQTHIETEILERIYPNFDVIHVKAPQSLKPIPLQHYTLEYDEITALAENIAAEILIQKVSPENIKVHVSNDSYETLISLIFPRYHIPFHLERNTPLWELPITQEIILMIEDKNESPKTIIDNIYERLTMMAQSPLKKTIAIKISNVLERYLRTDVAIDALRNIIEHEFKKTSIRLPRKENAVIVTHLEDAYLNKEDRVYLCGVNEGYFPKKISTASIIEDEMASAIGFETVAEKSTQKTYEAQALLEHPQVRMVSYSDKSFTEEKIASGLIENYKKNGRLFEENPVLSELHFSYENDFIDAGKRIESVLIYGHEDPLISKTIASVERGYKKYPDRFKHKDSSISKDLVDRLLLNINRTSYSKMDDFFKCEFRFLLRHLLNVEERSNNRFSRFIGSFFHEALSLIETLPLDRQERYSVYQSLVNKLESKETDPLSYEEQFYARNLFPHLDEFIEHVKSFHAQSEFNIFDLERRYEVPLKGQKITKMVGIVDKIMSYQNHFAIIDYKSSDRTMNIKHLEKGLNSQLPFYMNVVRENTPELDTPIALYYHPFSMNVYKDSKSLKIANQQKADWQMQGYIEPEFASLFDPSHVTGGYIKNLKRLKNSEEFSKSANLLSIQDLSALGQFIKNKVNDAILHIESGQFKINPKGSHLDDSESCQYCKFKDICYRNKSDLEPYLDQSDTEIMSKIRGGLNDSF